MNKSRIYEIFMKKISSGQCLISLVFLFMVFSIINLNRMLKTQECPYDAIFVLGGGVPLTKDLPPEWVQSRSQKAAEIFNSHPDHCKPYILALSGGSAHAPQLIEAYSGLPVFESAATAAFLANSLQVEPEKIMFETSSYDTIGNAFFARTSFANVQKWKSILVITSNSHMNRSRMVFSWVFSLPSESCRDSYELAFMETPDDGLSEEAVVSRNKRESRSAENFKILMKSGEIKNLKQLQLWMTTKHSLYATKLLGSKAEMVEESVRETYGKKKQQSP